MGIERAQRAHVLAEELRRVEDLERQLSISHARIKTLVGEILAESKPKELELETVCPARRNDPTVRCPNCKPVRIPGTECHAAPRYIDPETGAPLSEVVFAVKNPL